MRDAAEVGGTAGRQLVKPGIDLALDTGLVPLLLRGARKDKAKDLANGYSTLLPLVVITYLTDKTSCVKVLV
jgi:hypothetical protein